ALGRARRQGPSSQEQYRKSPEGMAELRSDSPQPLENSVEIARRCNIDVQLGTYYLPEFPIPDGLTMDEYFRKVSLEGLQERLKVILPPGSENYEERRQVYLDRLKFE